MIASGATTSPSPKKLRLRPGNSELTLQQILGLFDEDLVSLLRASAGRTQPAELSTLRAELELRTTGEKLERELATSSGTCIADSSR